MARRQDHAGLDIAQRHRLVSGGLDEVWVRQQNVRNAAPANELERIAA